MIPKFRLLTTSKSSRWAWGILLSSLLTGCVTGRTFEPAKTEWSPLQGEQARMIFYMPGMLSVRLLRPVDTEARLDGQTVCHLYAGVYCVKDAGPGMHEIQIQSLDKEYSSTRVMLYPGETKSVRLTVQNDQAHGIGVDLISDTQATRELRPTQDFQETDAERDVHRAHLVKDHASLGVFASYGDLYPVGWGAGLELSSSWKMASLQLGYSQVGSTWGTSLYGVLRTQSILYLSLGAGLGYLQVNPGDIHLNPYETESFTGFVPRSRLGVGWQITRDLYVEAGFKTSTILLPIPLSSTWKGAYLQMGYRF